MGYRDYSTAKGHIVDATGSGDFTTISAALTAASSGQTIFVRPGTYTENPTLKAGVDIVAYTADGFNGNVIIIGKLTATYSGTATISGIDLKTNGDYCVSVSGSSATVLKLIDCFVLAQDHTALQYSSSGVGSSFYVYSCSGSVATSGIAMFDYSGAGIFYFKYCDFSFGNGNSTTANTASGLELAMEYCSLNTPVTLSGTGALTSRYNHYVPNGNVTCLTVGSSGTNTSFGDSFNSGTASAISISGGDALYLSMASVNSSNTNAITGAGTLNYSAVSFRGSSHLINTTTLAALVMDTPSISFDGGTNTLSTYKTGTWTPGISFGGGTTGITYTTQNGTYTQIGNVVIAGFTISVSSKGSSTGTFRITGLPVSTGTNANNYTCVCGAGNITLTANYTVLLARGTTSATTLDVTQFSNANQSYILADNTNCAASLGISGTIVYTTA